jgi:hypothetical protein
MATRIGRKLSLVGAVAQRRRVSRSRKAHRLAGNCRPRTRLVLRTSTALYVDDLKAVGEFTVDSGQSVPPRHGRLPSVGLAFLEGKPMSAKGRLARRISSIASFNAIGRHGIHGRQSKGIGKSGKRRADWRWTAWIARPRKGGPAVYWACARRRVLITTNGARTEQYLGRQAQAPRRKGFCLSPEPERTRL